MNIQVLKISKIRRELRRAVPGRLERTSHLEHGRGDPQRRDRAHKRYLGAIKALAQVRKLQLPTMQVNIGEKQVNVGQLHSAPLVFDPEYSTVRLGFGEIEFFLSLIGTGIIEGISK